MARAASVPPVIEEISSGTCRRLPSSVDAGVDRGQIELGQRLVHQPVALEAVGQAGKLDIFFQVDADVIGLAAIVSHGGLRDA